MVIVIMVILIVMPKDLKDIYIFFALVFRPIGDCG